MNRTVILAIVFTVAIPSFLCHAASPKPGPYTSGFIGVTLPHNQDVNSFDYYTGTGYSDRVEFDPGVSIGGTGGYDFGLVRVEGEISYKYSEIKAITDKNNGAQLRNVDGNIGALAVMFNAFFDFHNSSRITPYIGGGIGFAGIHLSDTYVTNTSATPITRSLRYNEDSDSVFAYQVGAGVEVVVSRRLSLDIGYRYFGTETACIGNNNDYRHNYNWIETNLKFVSHNATAGVRFKF